MDLVFQNEKRKRKTHFSQIRVFVSNARRLKAENNVLITRGGFKNCALCSDSVRLRALWGYRQQRSLYARRYTSASLQPFPSSSSLFRLTLHPHLPPCPYTNIYIYVRVICSYPITYINFCGLLEDRLAFRETAADLKKKNLSLSS